MIFTESFERSSEKILLFYDTMAVSQEVVRVLFLRFQEHSHLRGYGNSRRWTFLQLILRLRGGARAGDGEGGGETTIDNSSLSTKGSGLTHYLTLHFRDQPKLTIYYILLQLV